MLFLESDNCAFVVFAVINKAIKAIHKLINGKKASLKYFIRQFLQPKIELFIIEIFGLYILLNGSEKSITEKLVCCLPNYWKLANTRFCRHPELLKPMNKLFCCLLKSRKPTNSRFRFHSDLWNTGYKLFYY